MAAPRDPSLPPPQSTPSTRGAAGTPQGAQKWLLLVRPTKARATPSRSLGDRQSGSRVQLWSHPELAGWPWVGRGRSRELRRQPRTQWGHPSVVSSSGRKSHSLAGWNHSQGEEAVGVLGSPGLGLGSWGLPEHPGVQQPRRKHSEAARERPRAGEGSAQIYPPIPRAPGSGARSYLPSPAWGGGGGSRAGWGGTLPGDWTQSRPGSPKPHQVGDSH